MSKELVDPSNLGRRCLVTDTTSKPADDYLVVIGGIDLLYLVSGFAVDKWTHQGVGIPLDFGSHANSPTCRWARPDEIIWADQLHKAKLNDNLFNINDL